VTVLVLSHAQDLHATRVLAALASRGRPAFLLDLAQLPEHASVTVDYDDAARPSATLRPAGAAPVALTDVSAVWWRRPQYPRLDMITDPVALGFTHGEWHEALNGLYQLIEVPWMNDPMLDERASRKLLQLREASRLGLRIPRTLVTSDPVDARQFVDRLGVGNVIYKIFSATPQVWRETRLVRAADLADLDSLRLAPVIFQEYIPARADIRVTVVGRRFYPMAIHTRGTSYEVDFRVSLGEARTEPIELPAELETRLRLLVDHFGLAYGGIDLRLTDDGSWVFLEINPAGEFLFCEVGAGWPITDAVAAWLADPPIVPADRQKTGRTSTVRSRSSSSRLRSTG
jgi:hypothetical protein